ncbi:MAG: O-acetyl-ADP-ribose deacetylase [Desulfobacterales bacterium]|jgi:O-acetyl-ADP-ribose deacetylase (regulator of RNase III)
MTTEVRDRIDIRRGDITRLTVDAIVNAANTSLLGGGGVDGAIHRAAGPQLLEECRSIGGCPPGEARITGGYNLPARFVIHTVGPVYHRTTPEKAEGLLTRCYENSLALAAQNDVELIAFPAISCGVYGYPIEKACRVAIDTTIRFLETETVVKKIIFVLFSEADRKVYADYLAHLGNFLD